MTNLKNIFLLLIILLSGLSVTYAKEIKIQGQVIDSTSNNPLVLATFQILDQNQKIVFTSIIQQEDARFAFDNIRLGNRNYHIAISYLGYNKKMIPIDGKKVNKTLDLGTIRMVPLIQTLDEVTVTVSTPKIRQTVDRTTYIIDSMLLAKVFVSTDLLKKIPEIAVDELNRTINIKGKENTLVLLNGINTGESISLRGINFRDILRVEVITSPSSGTDVAYDGIINIILKPKVHNGITIDFEETLKADLHSNESYLGFALDNNKVKIKLSYFNHYIANPYNINELRIDDITGNTYGTNGYCSKPLEINHIFRLNLDYYFSAKNFFNITTKTTLNKSNKDNRYFPYALKNGIHHDLSEFHTRYSTNYLIGNYTLFYRRTFAKTSDYLSINTNIGFMNATIDTNTEYTNESTYLNNESSDKFNINLKIEYHNRITERLSIHTGAQGYFQKFKGFENEQPNENNFKNYRYNAYADLFFTVKAFQFKIGLKGEVNTNDFVNSAYGSNTQTTLYPTAVASIRFNDWHSLNLSYRRLSYYPSAWKLTPYKTQNDDKTTFTGNPKLNPSLRNNIELAYTYRSKPLFLNLALYYFDQDKIIVNMRYYNSDLNSTIIPENAGKLKRIGFKLNGELNYLEGAISIDPVANFFYEKATLDSETRQNYSYTAGGSVILALPLGFGCGGYGSYTGKRLTVQGYLNPRFAIEAIFIMKRFNKINLNLFAGYQYLTQSANVNYTRTANYIQRDYFKFDSKGLVFRLNYYFMSGKQIKMERVKTYFDDDKK